MGCSYRDLRVWQKSIELVTDVYRATNSLPKSEIYGLTSQMRRAVVSVSSNIAEGQGRLTKNEFRHFLGQARGSLLELETQCYIAEKLGYLDSATLDDLLAISGDVSRMLHRLVQSISEPNANQKLETRNQKLAYENSTRHS